MLQAPLKRWEKFRLIMLARSRADGKCSPGVYNRSTILNKFPHIYIENILLTYDVSTDWIPYITQGIFLGLFSNFLLKILRIYSLSSLFCKLTVLNFFHDGQTN